jgi:hypothetical protein
MNRSITFPQTAFPACGDKPAVTACAVQVSGDATMMMVLRAISRQYCARYSHIASGFMHESPVSVGGIGLGINPGASTKIEHGCSRGQKIQRQFLKSVAHQPVPRRGQHEFVVLLSGMHVDDQLAGKFAV